MSKTKYRANDRHPVDCRMLIIHDPEEFRLWHDRLALGISGLIYSPPITRRELEKAGKHIAKITQKPRTPFSRHTLASNDSVLEANFDLGRDSDNALERAMAHAGFGYTTRQLVSNLSGLFCLATQHEKAHFFEEAFVRVNSNMIGDFHAHPRAMTFSFAQGSTVFRTGGENYPGDEYSFESGVSVLFDATVWHKSQTRNDAWDKTPRVDLVIA